MPLYGGDERRIITKSTDHSIELFGLNTIIGHAVASIANIFLQEAGDIFESGKEFVATSDRYVGDVMKVHTLHIRKHRSFRRLLYVFGRETYLYRNVLSVADLMDKGLYQCGLYLPEALRDGRDLELYKGSEPLRCKLFLASSSLRGIAESVLEPLAKRLGYSHVEYVDMTSNQSAWYPGEGPEFPKARLLNA